MPAAIPAITLGALQSSGRGQKSIPILGSDGKAVFLYPGALEVPFNASAYQNPEASRVNLCYTPTKDFEEQIKALDAEVQKQLQKRLSEMFGTQAGAIEKQGEWYQSPHQDVFPGLRDSAHEDEPRRAPRSRVLEHQARVPGDPCRLDAASGTPQDLDSRRLHYGQRSGAHPGHHGRTIGGHPAFLSVLSVLSLLNTN